MAVAAIDPVRLVVGLGNPGSQYAKTRHNAGFWWIDALAAGSGCLFNPSTRHYGECARIKSGRHDVWLFKPLTFMNESGKAVAAFTRYYNLDVGAMLVVHDEIDLEPGIIRFKSGGGAGGNNGVRDIIEKLGSREFLRLRIGVGHPGRREAVVSHVLGYPGGDERELIQSAIERGLKVMDLMFSGERERAMTLLHSGNASGPQSETDVVDESRQKSRSRDS